MMQVWHKKKVFLFFSFELLAFSHPNLPVETFALRRCVRAVAGVVDRPHADGSLGEVMESVQKKKLLSIYQTMALLLVEGERPLHANVPHALAAAGRPALLLAVTQVVRTATAGCALEEAGLVSRSALPESTAV